MKKNLIIIESDDLKEIEQVKKLLETNNVEFNYFPAMDPEILKKTKSYYESLLEKFK